MNNCINKFLFFVIASIAWILNGCQTHSSTSTTVNAAADSFKLNSTLNDKTINSVKPALVTVLPVRLGTKFKPLDCPANSTAWKKENLEKLIEYANACATHNQSNRLEDLGSWLAQKFSDYPWGAFYISMAAGQRKEWTRAIWMIDLAIKKEPNSAILVYQKARIFWGMSEIRLAIQTFEESLKLNPRLGDANLFLAQMYHRDQDYKKAAQYYQAFINIEKENGMGLSGLAEVKLAQGQTKVAVELYERAVNSSPRNIDYRYRLGQIYENEVKDMSAALSTYRRLKILMTEQNSRKENLSMDLSEKIRQLEKLLEPEAEKSISRSQASPQGVRK